MISCEQVVAGYVSGLCKLDEFSRRKGRGATSVVQCSWPGTEESADDFALAKRSVSDKDHVCGSAWMPRNLARTSREKHRCEKQV